MKVLVFGNTTYAPDSLPLEILPQLRLALPQIDFVEADPNEDWEVNGAVTIIDTIINLTEPRQFDSLDIFVDAPNISMHDFDALAQLRLLKKLGTIDQVCIFGLPPNIDAVRAVEWLTQQLTKKN
ncbi:MAG: hypothetical protein V1738_03540 [Patescibacteria group bacterium]